MHEAGHEFGMEDDDDMERMLQEKPDPESSELMNDMLRMLGAHADIRKGANPREAMKVRHLSLAETSLRRMATLMLHDKKDPPRNE